MLIRLISGFFLLSCLTACGSKSDADQPLRDEAIRYHTEANEIQQAVELKLDQLDSLKTVLASRKTSQSQALSQSLDSLKTAFEAWEENLIEPPGMPAHSHEHGEGHEHHHNHSDGTMKDLPADQMRDLQKELLNNIRQIQQRTEQVMAQVK
ncbi:hypothetical protein [Spirosoma montaniterrae]|uniref:Uncharacterized protein n=1 Tax=Spirosoma montaniterrae TaxID=1178516 RepID=A0A1P9X3P2_9BACT|nr:hypothetical protein [Spirosoma montaniterrae]AQG82227.1 hypothetical protein AWR27_00080 [Spirosoma montaniterrae]